MESFDNGIYLVSIRAEQVSIMEQQNPVLNVHEVVAVYNGDVFVGHKVGNGVNKWSDLKFTDNIKDIKECWLYIPDNDNPGKMKVGGKILLDPGPMGLDGLND
jgi:hypothetical protein